jgi:oligoendopeptidase F
MLKKLVLATVLFCSLNAASFMDVIAQGDLPTRDKVEDKYKWKLTDLYQNDKDWEKDFDYVKSQLPKFADYKGKISKSP